MEKQVKRSRIPTVSLKSLLISPARADQYGNNHPAARNEQNPMRSPMLTIKEAADYLRLSRSMVEKLLQHKRLPQVKIGARTFLLVGDLDTFIERNRRNGRRIA